MNGISSELLQFARPLVKGPLTLDPSHGEVIYNKKPKKAKPYADRTYSRVRTRSLRQFAGSKALKPKYNSPKRHTKFPMLSGDGGQKCHPMNLSASSNFLDIETLFDSSAFLRAQSGRPQLATYYK